MSKKRHLPLFVFAAPLALWWGTSAFQSEAITKPEYRIEVDIPQTKLDEMIGEGWEYVGYLGQSSLGDRVDETLWKRSSRH